MAVKVLEWRISYDRRLRMIPYLTLAASTLLVFVTAARVPAPVLPVVAGTAGWIFWFVTGHPRWEQRDGIMLVFFAGLLVLMATLVGLDSFFGFFAWTGYLFTVYALRGRWRLVGAGAVAFITASSQAGGFGHVFGSDRDLPFFLLVLVFNVGVATTMTYLAILTTEQAVRRQQMLDELARANAKLEAAMIENAGLHAQLLAGAREAGMLDERQRMAGEIHDVLAQGLTGIVTQLEAAEAAGVRHRHLDQAKTLARDSLAEARRSVQALRPRPLAAAALPEALAEVADGWQELNGVPVELITTGTAVPLLPEVETTLLRTAQEALANVAKHAGASRVALTLSYMEDLVTLDVRDDGAGFDPSAPVADGHGGGFGLAAMRERVVRIAGTLDVESEPGAGTAISACAPAIPAIPSVSPGGAAA
jgi:signal transduction histidine kinase